MKEALAVLALITGLVLVAFGNDLGLLGFIPATIIMLAPAKKV